MLKNKKELDSGDFVAAESDREITIGAYIGG